MVFFRSLSSKISCINFHFWQAKKYFVQLLEKLSKVSWLTYHGLINPKKTGEGGQFDAPCGFSKTVSSKQRIEPCFSFNFIITPIFPENFIEILQIVQNIWKLPLRILAIFMDFIEFWGLTFPFYKETNDVSLQQMM